MTSENSPRLALPFIQSAQAQKHVTVNESLWKLDAIVHLNVSSRSVTSQPQNPAPQDAYILPLSRSGANWDDYPLGSIAIFRDGLWSALPAEQGFMCYIADENKICVYDGSAWIEPRSEEPLNDKLGINTDADDTNRFSVKSDAVLLSHDDVTPGSGDIRVGLNKNTTNGVSSLLFKTGYSARCEIGLVGSDDTVLRVSADGSSFATALHVDAATGRCSFPNTPLTDVKFTVFNTGTHTYTPPSGVCALIFTVIGGGGGGAGAETTSAAIFVGAGGGGAGGVCLKTISAIDLAQTYAIEVGAGGYGGTAGQNAATGARTGGLGTPSSVSAPGLLIKAFGGQGAIEDKAEASATAFSGGSGGDAIGGDVNHIGQRGGSGVTKGGSTPFQGGFGIGGSTIFGQGGSYRNGNGLNGTGFGSGGSGCGMIPGYILNRAGGSGAAGIVIVEELYG